MTSVKIGQRGGAPLCVINTYVLAAIVTLQLLFAVGPNFVIQRAKT